MEPKIGLFRYIIEKWFCHHSYQNIEIIDKKDTAGNTIGKNILRECRTCGKSKVISL